MTEHIELHEAENPWMCNKCNQPLQPSKIMVSYLGNAYPVDLLRCPKCGLTMVSEDLALGRMVEVEQALEDK
jgi:RNase P subunit RPR2